MEAGASSGELEFGEMQLCGLDAHWRAEYAPRLVEVRYIGDAPGHAARTLKRPETPSTLLKTQQAKFETLCRSALVSVFGLAFARDTPLEPRLR